MRASRALCVVALVLLPCTAFAAGNPAASGADCGVLASSGAEVSDGLSFLDRPLEDAQPRTCNAEAQCGEGVTVSCSGSNTCQSFDGDCLSSTGYVSCDGVVVTCDCCEVEYRRCWSSCTTIDPCVADCRDAYYRCLGWF